MIWRKLLGSWGSKLSKLYTVTVNPKSLTAEHEGEVTYENVTEFFVPKSGALIIDYLVDESRITVGISPDFWYSFEAVPNGD